jgi:hypothetical protein
MRSFRDFVVSWCKGTGCAVIGSALTNSGVASSPSLSSSITSAGGSDVGETRCGCETVGLVVRAGTGVGPGERRTVVLGIWLGVRPSGEAGIGDAGAGAGGAEAEAEAGGGGVCADKSGAREGAVSSKVR